MLKPFCDVLRELLLGDLIVEHICPVDTMSYCANCAKLIVSTGGMMMARVAGVDEI
jgi:hypothetical protein